MKVSRLTAHLALGLLLSLGFSAPAVAATSKSSTSSKKPATSSSTSNTTTSASGQIDSTSSNVQGYAAASPLQIGVIVQLVSKTTNQVSVATQADLAHMYGVTVDPHQLSVTISNTGLPNEAYVATGGTWNLLVSSQGGPIQTGDYVTLSSIDGVAMKADTDQKTVFGRAAASFDGKTNSIGSVQLKDTKGTANQTVNLATIPVTIDIGSNPIIKSTKANLPKELQRIGKAIAEKPVSPARIYMSIVVVGLTVIATIIMLYSGVRSAIFSIGRNPLSKGLVIRGLFTVIIASIIVLTVGLFTVYLLLKL